MNTGEAGPSTVTNVEFVEPAPPKRRGVTIEDEDEEDENTGDFAPGGDADYFVEEDEEGRFFGGGLTDEQKQILNIFDGSTTEGVQDGVSRDTLLLWVHTDFII